MKKYVEANRKKPFDWNKLLGQEKISHSQWGKAQELAESWVTCACGNQCNVIPRFNDGQPVDDELSEIGADFFRSIQERDAELAKLILKKIEKRSAQLIKIELYQASKVFTDAGVPHLFVNRLLKNAGFKKSLI